MKINRKFSVLAIATLGLAGIASADSEKGRPFKVELGVYFPTFSVDGISKDTGATFAFGYNFLNKSADKKMPVQFGIETRGTAYKVSDATDDATISIGALFANADMTAPDGKLYYGLHLGFGRGEAKNGNVSVSDNNTRFLYGAHVGYNFSPTVYGVVRYTHGSQEAYRGVDVAVGYRF